MLKTVSSITNAIGALNYKGTWNASTNTPTIASGIGVKGDYYVVSVGGSTAIDGLSNWGVGDWITYNGSVWQRVEGGADLNGVNLSVTGASTLNTVSANTVSNAVGTAAAPTYNFTGNTTTGLFAPTTDTLGVAIAGAEALRFASTRNIGIRKTSRLVGRVNTDNGSADRYETVIGNDNGQGFAQVHRAVIHRPVVSAGTQLIIPIISQSAINQATFCKIWGMGLMFNTTVQLPFKAEFYVGHINSLSGLATVLTYGNTSSISSSGMNVLINFTNAYTSATANGVTIHIEWMTHNTDASTATAGLQSGVNLANIAMN